MLRLGLGATGHVRQEYAHRLSYETFCGPIPDGLLVRHLCNQRLCVNPCHLATGTYRDNAHDSIRSGTWAWGERQSTALLTDAQALAVLTDSRTTSTVAKELGVPYRTIWRIRARETYPHLHTASKKVEHDD